MSRGVESIKLCDVRNYCLRLDNCPIYQNAHSGLRAAGSQIETPT